MDFMRVEDLTEAADTLTQHMTRLYYQDQTYLTQMPFTSAILLISNVEDKEVHFSLKIQFLNTKILMAWNL